MRVLKSPIAVVWEVTNDCNFQCPHCRAYMTKSNYDSELEDKIIKEIVKNEILSVNLSGGEPLLHPRIGEFIEIFSNYGIDVGISTNGWLFEKKGIELKENGLCFLQVSVDGPKEKHDLFRGVPGAFEKGIKALELARSLDVRTQMNVTITSDNLDTLEYNIQLAEQLGIDRIFFRRVLPTGKGEVNKYVLPDKNKYLKKIKSLSKIRIEGLDIAIDDPVLSVMKAENEIDWNMIGCTAGLKSLGISGTGEVYPCIFYRKSVGNLRSTTLEDIWNNAELLKALRNKSIGECGKCKYCFVCGGCRAFCDGDKRDKMCPIV